MGYVGKAAIDAITRSTPALTRAFWRATLVDEAILRQWLVNVGRKEAYAAIAHLLCELHQRLQIVGLVEGDSFELPLTQQDLADATGIQMFTSPGAEAASGRRLSRAEARHATDTRIIEAAADRSLQPELSSFTTCLWSGRMLGTAGSWSPPDRRLATEVRRRPSILELCQSRAVGTEDLPARSWVPENGC